MITPEPPAGSEHYREGWRHGYEQAAIDRERSDDVAAPDIDRWLYETFTRHGTAARWARLDAEDRAYWTRKAAEIRALLAASAPGES